MIIWKIVLTILVGILALLNGAPVFSDTPRTVPRPVPMEVPPPGPLPRTADLTEGLKNWMGHSAQSIDSERCKTYKGVVNVSCTFKMDESFHPKSVVVSKSSGIANIDHQAIELIKSTKFYRLKLPLVFQRTYKVEFFEPNAYPNIRMTTLN